MGTYLEDFLESMYMLPSEIKRNFDLMRELDKTSHPLMDELKTFHREHLVSARRRVVECCAQRAAEGAAEPDDNELRALVETDATLDKLKEKHQRVVQKLDEKIAIAAQCYDLVDHHIRRLDQDLEAYATLLKANGEFEDDKTHVKKRKLSSQTSSAGDGSSGGGGAGYGAAGASDAAIKAESGSGSGRQSASDRGRGSTSAGGSGSSGLGAGAGSAAAAAAAAAQQQLSSAQATGTSRKSGASGSTTGRKRSAAAAAAAAAAVVPVVETVFPVGADDLPIDPNEPVYCHCRRVSYGQMVGCDNDDCKYEWFHFECVGLTDQPQGTWYCNDCKAALGIK